MDDESKSKLKDYLKKVELAAKEVDEGFLTNRLSDAKSKIFELKRDAEELEIPEVQTVDHIQNHADSCWTAISSSQGGDPLERASRAMAELGTLEKYLKTILDNSQ